MLSTTRTGTIFLYYSSTAVLLGERGFKPSMRMEVFLGGEGKDAVRAGLALALKP